MRKFYFLVMMIFGSLSHAQQTHSVTVTISANCQVLGLENNSKEILLIYPTPLKAGEQPMLKVQASFDGIFSITDLQGKLLLQKSLKQGLVEVDLKSLGTGVYIVHLINDQTQLTNRIIIE